MPPPIGFTRRGRSDKARVLDVRGRGHRPRLFLPDDVRAVLVCEKGTHDRNIVLLYIKPDYRGLRITYTTNRCKKTKKQG